MSDDKNVKAVKNAYLAYQDGDVPALLRGLTDNVWWFEIGPPDLIPTAGKRKGRKQVGEFFATLDRSEEVQILIPQHFVAQGNMVVVLGELQSRVRATGGMINSPWVHVFTISDGKISEFRSFYDTAAAVTAFEDIRTRMARAEIPGTLRPGIL